MVSLSTYPKKKNKNPKIRFRYEASSVNAIWHGDIHYIIFNYEIKYLFALIDDKSRFITGWGMFEHKTCFNCIQVFNKAIENYGRPLCYFSDNGKENVGSPMKAFLHHFEIRHITTIPGNPEANGKIEKFWLPLEKRFRIKLKMELIKNWNDII